jgi:hypothetical protein
MKHPLLLFAGFLQLPFLSHLHKTVSLLTDYFMSETPTQPTTTLKVKTLHAFCRDTKTGKLLQWELNPDYLEGDESNVEYLLNNVALEIEKELRGSFKSPLLLLLTNKNPLTPPASGPAPTKFSRTSSPRSDPSRA